MAHRHRARADEALPAVLEQEPLDRPADRVRAIEHPHRLAVLRRGLEHVAQRRDEGVDARAEVLQVDEQNVERLHHRGRRPAHFAVQAEDRDPVGRVDVVGRLDHVVLLVAAHAVLRPECGGQAEVLMRCERIDRVREIGGDRGRVGEQGDATAIERLPDGAVEQQAVNPEFHRTITRNAKVDGSWKSGRSLP